MAAHEHKDKVTLETAPLVHSAKADKRSLHLAAEDYASSWKRFDPGPHSEHSLYH